jgi:molybdopterin-synthase adenylyltransferase
MSLPMIVLPDEFAKLIAECGKPWGILELHADWADGVFLVDGFLRGGQEGGRHGGSDWGDAHYLASAPRERLGLWFRADPFLHFAGAEGLRRSGSLALEDFKAGVEIMPIGLHKQGHSLALTYAVDDEGARTWLAWMLSDAEQSATVVGVAHAYERMPLLMPVVDHWPLVDLARRHVVVLGVGSIGSHVLDALVEYGIRRLTLVDNDRLLPHNFARHRAHPRYTGRLKVSAERARLLERDPSLEIEALSLDVIYDADSVRPLLAEADLCLVALDGVSPRRVANHLARRAGTPAVFACVLENGAVGELVRIASPRTGCLACLRDHLREQGGIEPEATLDRGYGTGTRHLPMTANGADLGLVGQLAAKVAIATLLQADGYRDQILAGDHVVIGLRPLPSIAAPFDLKHAGEIRWEPLPPPRPGCLSCQS